MYARQKRRQKSYCFDALGVIMETDEAMKLSGIILSG